jgi:hypothetical protein
MYVPVCLAIYSYGRKPQSPAVGNGTRGGGEAAARPRGGGQRGLRKGRFRRAAGGGMPRATFLLDVLSRESLSLSVGGVSNCATFPFTSLSRPLRMALSPVMFGLVIAIRL